MSERLKKCRHCDKEKQHHKFLGAECPLDVKIGPKKFSKLFIFEEYPKAKTKYEIIRDEIKLEN